MYEWNEILKQNQELLNKLLKETEEKEEKN